MLLTSSTGWLGRRQGITHCTRVAPIPPPHFSSATAALLVFLLTRVLTPPQAWSTFLNHNSAHCLSCWYGAASSSNALQDQGARQCSSFADGSTRAHGAVPGRRACVSHAHAFSSTTVKGTDFARPNAWWSAAACSDDGANLCCIVT